jgi:hypothetical protein
MNLDGSQFTSRAEATKLTENALPKVRNLSFLHILMRCSDEWPREEPDDQEDEPDQKDDDEAMAKTDTE